MKPKVYITYRHLRRASSYENYDKGGATICARVDLRNSTIEFAFTFCNVKAGDIFCKAEGRKWAYRYFKQSILDGTEDVIPYDKDLTIVTNILNYVRDHPEDFPFTTKYLEKYVY